jgi:hypothetical protein
VQALGWMALPALDHYYIDNVWHELAAHARCLAYCPDVVVEHAHFLRDKTVEHDATYKETEQRFWPDQAAFQTWEAAQMAVDVITVKRVCEEARQA